MTTRAAGEQRHATLATLALLAACVLFTFLMLNQPRVLGIRISLTADGALFIFPRPARTACALAVLLLLSGAALAAGSRLGSPARRGAGRGRLVWSLAPLSLLPLALVPTILRSLVPDFLSANILFYLPAALLATVLIRLLSLVRADREQSRPGPGLVLPAIVVGTLFYTFAGWYFSRMAGEHSGDEGHYLVQAESLSRDHDLDLGNNLKRDAAGNLQYEKHHVSPRSRGGHAYSWHPFGLSLLLWPAMSTGLLARHFVLGALAALGVGGMLALGGRCRAQATSSLVVTALIAFSMFWAVYAFRALPEVLGATLLLWLTVATFSQAESPWASVVTGALCCTALPWAHTRFIPSSLLGAALFLLAGAVAGGAPRRRLSVFSGLCLAGYALYFAVMASMFEGAQSYPVRSWLLEYPAGMWHALTGYRGVLYSLPLFSWLLAASVFAAAADRESRFPAIAALLQFAAVLVTSCGTTSWHGGACVAGRYLLVATPLLVGPAARQFDRADQPARWWLAFLGICSGLTFLLVLLRLPELGMSFGYPDRSLPEVLPLLVGWLQPLLGSDPPQWPIYALVLYGATGLLFALRGRRGLWQVALMIGVAAAAAVGHRQAIAEGPEYDVVRNARALSELDLSRSLILVRGLPAARRPLLGNIDALAEVKPASLTTRDLGVPVLDGVVSLPRTAANDWEGREHRWADLLPPFPAGRGRGLCLLRLQGRIEGDATLTLAVRRGEETLLEREAPHGSGGVVDACATLECGGGGEVRLLARLSGGAGDFVAESAAWAPCDPQLLAAGHLALPDGCH